ncbi:hypothetical protein CsatB_000771 [Cannabis sativa]
MDKGVAGGWTKYEQIGPLKYLCYLLLPFLKNGEILMEVFEDDIWGAKYMASCNIRTQKIKNVVLDADGKLEISYDWLVFFTR